MGLGIITPHYNDLEGLKRIYSCLQKQTCYDWEWIIVDDYSTRDVIDEIEEWFSELEDEFVKLICNTHKTNASVCRNMGIDHTAHEHLVFLDSDDMISEDFVANRSVKVEEFVVFSNFEFVNTKNEHFSSNGHATNPLDSYLSANFIWQTTCVLWNKTFLIQIGKFDPNLNRLQDVELSIRALFAGKNYKIIDNQVDFFYFTKPIRLRPNIVIQASESVNYLISKIHTNYTLDTYQHSLIKAYYYLCVKCLHRTESRKDISYTKGTLKLFRKKKYINAYVYFVGFTLLVLFKLQLISNSLFIRTNRYFFK